MKKFFYVDFMRLLDIITPTFLRSQMLLKAILRACFHSIETLYNAFSMYRHKTLYLLDVSPQVCDITKLLNDRFDNVDRRIYLSDGAFFSETYLYQPDEAKDLYLYTGSENESLFFYTGKEVGTDGADFVVCVPRALVFNVPEMEALIDNYKLISKTYIIVKV